MGWKGARKSTAYISHTLYIYMCVCVNVYVYIYIYSWFKSHIYIYIYVCVYIYICIYIYIYVCFPFLNGRSILFSSEKPPAFHGRRLHCAVAVEPLPEVASSLRRSVQMNGWEHKFQADLAVDLPKVGDLPSGK